MRDAYGGIVNLSMIVVFLLLVCGYLAFNVNYTKAFRVKNYIITAFEQYEGNCDNDSDACVQKISDYIAQIGYSAPDFDLNSVGYEGCDEPGSCGCQRGYCYKKYTVSGNGDDSISENDTQVYYRITTQINVDIPIINKIMPNLKIFQVSGNTKLITPFN